MKKVNLKNNWIDLKLNIPNTKYMIIDQLNKFIFVHIPKSGGTSIHKLLENNNEFTISLWGKNGNKDYAHLSIFDVHSMHQSSKSYFSFAVVRNPYNRIYSAYKQPYCQLYPNLTFNDFIINFVSKLNLNNLDQSLVHIWPMHKFIISDNKLLINYVIRFEQLDKDFEFIKYKFGIKPQLGHLNKNSEHSDSYLNKYTKNQIDIINRIYAEDFEWFNYQPIDVNEFC